MIQAIIFDMNGVIIDDEPLHEIAFKEIFRDHGILVTTEDYRTYCMGQSDKDGIQALIKKLNLDLPWKTLYAKKQEKYLELAEADLTLVPGLIDALKRLQKNYQLCVGSSIRRSDIEYILNRFKIRQFFKSWVGRDEVERGKPNPDIYLEAAKRLGVQPDECVAIEDSLAGIESAKNARMICIGITTTHTANEMPEADACLESFDQLTQEYINSLRT